MAQGLFPFSLPTTDEEELPTPEADTEEPLLMAQAPTTKSPVGMPAPRSRDAGTLPDDLLDIAIQDAAPFFDSRIPKRERSTVGEVFSAGARGGIPGTLEAFGQAIEAFGGEGVGEALQGAGKHLRKTYPGIFEPGQGAQQPGLTRTVAMGVEGLATSLGVSIPTVAAALGVTAATGGTGLIPVISTYIMTSPLVLSAASYQQFYDAATKAGVPEDVASSGAIKSALAEGVPELIGNVIDTLLVSKGFTKAAAGGIIKKITGELGKDVGIREALKPTIRATLTRLAATSSTEAGEELATGALQQKIAADTGLEIDDSLSEQAGAGAVAGLIFGMMGGTLGRVSRGRNLRTLASADATPTERLRVAQTIGQSIEQSDPELGQSFMDFATKAIRDTQPIPLDQGVQGLLRPIGMPQSAPTQEFTDNIEPLAPVNVQTGFGTPPLVDETADMPATPPVQASTSEAPQPLASQDQGTVTVLQSEDGRLGRVGYNAAGVLEFTEMSQEQVGESPVTPISSDEFGLLVPQEGTIPEAVQEARQRFLQEQGIPATYLPPAERQIVQPGPTGEVVSSDPAQNRLEAEETALQFILKQQEQGFQGFNLQTAAQQLAEAHTLPVAEAQRILSDALSAARPPEPRAPVTLPQPQRPMGAAPQVAAAPRGRQTPVGMPGLGTRPAPVTPTSTPVQATAQPVRPPAPLSTQAGSIASSIAPQTAAEEVVVEPTVQDVAPAPVVSDPITVEAAPVLAEPTTEVADPITTEPMLAGAPLPPAPEGQQLSIQGQPTAPMSHNDVADAFPNATVNDLPDNGFRVTLPNGRALNITQASHIPVGPDEAAAFEVGYGRPIGDSTIRGRFIPGLPRGPSGPSAARIELVIGNADRVTLQHEIQHFLEHSGLLTPEETQILHDAMVRATNGNKRSTEDRAQWVAEQLNARRYRHDTRLGQVLDKVWDFLDRLLGLVGIRTVRGVLRSIESGDVIQRDASPLEGGGVQQFQAVTPPQRSANTPLPTEQKSFLDYLNISNTISPEARAALARTQVTFRKVYLGNAQMAQQVQERLDDWAENPEHFRRDHNLAVQGRMGDSILTNAWIAHGQQGLQLVDAALAQGNLTQAQYDAEVAVHFAPGSIYAMANANVSDAGRLLQSQQATPSAYTFHQRLEAIKKVRKMGEEEWKQWMTEWSKVFGRNDPQEMKDFLNSVKDTTLWQYMIELRYGSMLSGFTTQIANPAGNVFWGAFNQGVLRPMEGVADRLVAKWQGREQQRFVSETWPALMGLVRGLTNRENLRIVPTYLRGGAEAVRDLPAMQGKGFALQTKLERDIASHREHWKNARWQLTFPTLSMIPGFDADAARAVLKRVGIEQGAPIKVTRFLAPAVTIATRMMTSTDILTRLASFDAEMAGLSQRMAEMDRQAGRLEGMAVKDRAGWYLNHPTQAMEDEVMERVDILSFMDQPSVIARLLMRGRELPGWGKPLHGLFPFLATPDRLITRAVELVPLLGLIPLREGLYPNSGQALTQLIVRQVAGGVIMAIMYGLYREGLLTGAPPEDESERNAFFRQGKQAFAINLPGGYSISYRRFEPLNLAFAVPAVVLDAIKRYEERKEDANVMALMTYGSMAVVHHILEGSYFSGIQPLFGGMYGRNDPNRFLATQVDGMIPFQGLRANTQRVVDAFVTGEGSIVRNPKGLLQQLAGVPLISSVGVRYDAWGKPIVIPGNPASQFLPWRVSSANRDPVEQELARLEIFPGPPDTRDPKTGKKLPQEQYDNLTKIGGQAAKAKLDRLIRLPSYQMMPEETRKRLVKRALREGRESARDQLDDPLRIRPIPGVPSGSLGAIRG